MRNSLLFLLFLLFIAIANTEANQRDTIPVISFRAIDAISGKPVEMAHVINSTARYAAIADLLGYFKLPVSAGDTISITSLGYFNLTLFSWGQFSQDSTYYTIKLNPRSYQLKELKVSWFSNYDKFLRGVSQLNIPVSKEEEQIGRITDYFNRTIRKLDLLDLPQTSGGVVFGKDWLAKQNEKLNEHLEKERQRRLIERKYSAGIVSALTGLKGNEVHWFMEYCAFTDEFLMKTSDYEIREKVLDKLKVYNNNKTSKKEINQLQN